MDTVQCYKGFPGGTVVKNLPANADSPLEKEMATLSSILAWRSPWTEELEGYSPGDHKRVRHDLVTRKKFYT